MDIQKFSEQDRTFVDLLTFQVLRAGLPYVLSSIDAGVIASPSKQVYLGALYRAAERSMEDPSVNPTQYLDAQYYEYDFSRVPKGVKFPPPNGKFHEEMVSRLGITVDELAAVHPTTVPFLFMSAGQEVFLRAIKNSTPEQTRKFLSTIIPATTSLHKGDNKGSIAGALVFLGYEKVIQAVQEKVPDWAQILDHRQRNALFYCRDEEDFHLAVQGGAHADQTDKNGRTAVEWWTLVRSPAVSAQLSSLFTKLGHDTAPTIKDLMANKLFRLGVSEMDNGERMEFEKAMADPTWRWKGNLEGVSHEWTLQEIWRFGELAVINAHSKPINESLVVQFIYTQAPRQYNGDLNIFLQKVRGTLPSEFSKRLTSHCSTDFELALNFLGLVAPFTSDTRNLWGNKCSELYEKVVLQELSRLDIEGQKRLINGMEVLRDTKWAWDDLIILPILGQIFKNIAESKSKRVLDFELWGNYYLSVPMKHPFHTFPRAKNMVALANAKSSPHIHLSQNPLRTKILLKNLVVLGTAHGGKYVYSQDMIGELCEAIDQGCLADMDIPSRWLKNLPENVRIGVTKHLLTRKAQEKSEQLSIQANSPSKPKM